MINCTDMWMPFDALTSQLKRVSMRTCMSAWSCLPVRVHGHV